MDRTIARMLTLAGAVPAAMCTAAPVSAAAHEDLAKRTSVSAPATSGAVHSPTSREHPEFHDKAMKVRLVNGTGAALFVQEKVDAGPSYERVGVAPGQTYVGHSSHQLVTRLHVWAGDAPADKAPNVTLITVTVGGNSGVEHDWFYTPGFIVANQDESYVTQFADGKLKTGRTGAFVTPANKGGAMGIVERTDEDPFAPTGDRQFDFHLAKLW